MRSVIFRYESVAALAAALSEAAGSLALPKGETVNDGEWVLAIFEIGSKKRATATAARGNKDVAGVITLAFERRDWDRLVGFVSARSEHMRAARPVSRVPPASDPRQPSTRVASNRPMSSAKVPVAPPSAPPASVSDPPASTSSPPSLRGRRLDDLPSSSGLESSRVPFGARILVVDSEGAAGEDLPAVLSEMGLVVELVATALLAEEIIARQTFDAVVLDLRLSSSDPRAFVVKLRADVRLADVPVLFLSSKPTSRDVVDAFACGGDDFLPKPFRTTELAARVFGLLRRARLARMAGS